MAAAEREEWRRAALEQIHEAELIELTRGLQQFRSFSGEERETAEYYGAWLRDAGFEVSLPEAEPGRPNVVAILRGDGSGPSLMFNGHTDIDPLRGDWGGRDPWACYVEDGQLYGHGIQNMKGGDAAMAVASAALKRAGVPLKGDVIVAGVVGELQGGIGTVALLETGLVPEYAIVPEPTWLNVRTLHAGWWVFLVHVRGRSGWIGSMHLQKTVSAVEQMQAVLAALGRVRFTCTPHPELPGLPRMIVGGIRGGYGAQYGLWRPAMVPDRCSIICDVRLVPGQSIEQALADVERELAALRAADPDLETEIELPPATYAAPWGASKHGVPGLDQPKEAPLVQVMVRNHREVLGKDPEHVGAVLPNSYAGADSGHLQAAGAQVVNYGPSGATTGGASCVEVANLVNCARVHALSAIDLCTRTRAEVAALGGS